MSTTPKLDNRKYYRTQGVKIMNRIEIVAGKMMSEIDPQLEDAFWKAEEQDHAHNLRRAYMRLCELHDSLTSDINKGDA